MARQPATEAREPTEEMAAHYQDVVQIKDAVIAGDLPAARAPARRLRERPGAIPEAWRPFMAAKAESATLALSARSLSVAARAAAELANNCGECHEALGKGPRFDSAAAPPAPIAHDVGQQMLRHQWAADRMWDGLIARSEAAWDSGSVLLAEPALLPADLTANVELPDDLLGLNERVYALGERARETTAWPARARLYGEFLATCAACHLGGC